MSPENTFREYEIIALAGNGFNIEKSKQNWMHGNLAFTQEKYV